MEIETGNVEAGDADQVDQDSLRWTEPSDITELKRHKSVMKLSFSYLLIKGRLPRMDSETRLRAEKVLYCLRYGRAYR
jgi:hypothetical protein